MASAARHERRALLVGLAGNLVGALSAIGMYLHSRSDALLLDGLYTGVLAAASLVALQVSRAVDAPRNRAYPFGASGQEPLYMLFQSLAMIGMVMYAGVAAASKLIAVASGGTAPVVQLSGLGAYFSAMVLLNLALWWFYRRSWRLGGCSSELLISNSNTSLFDAAISAGTGMALVSSPLLLGTPLAFLTPVSDSLIVLVLSAVFLPAPLQELGQAVSESAGACVEPALHQRCQNTLAAEFNNHGCSLVELAMIKLGRTFTVVAYVDPSVALCSSDVDRLRQRLNLQMQQLLQAPVLCEVIPTAMHRRPPKAMIAEYGSVDAVLPPASEVLTLAEAIGAYTLNGARQLGKDQEIGSIEVGKKADLILLSQNLFKVKPDAIPATKVLATMFDGRIVHDVAYGIGDANLAELDKLDKGAVGLCPYGAPISGAAGQHDHRH